MLALLSLLVAASQSFKIINKLETFLLSENDHLRLSMFEYFEFDQTASTRLSASVLNVDADGFRGAKADSFSLEIEQNFENLNKNRSVANMVLSGFTGLNKNTFYNFCIEFTVENDGVKPVYSTCIPIVIKIIDINNLPEAVQKALDNTSFSYNPNANVPFVRNNKNVFASSLKYQISCKCKTGARCKEEFAPQLVHQPPAVNKRPVFVDQLNRRSEVFFISKLMVEYNSKERFIKVFEQEPSSSQYRLIRGLTVIDDCLDVKLFGLIDSPYSLFMLCYGSKQNWLQHFQVRKSDILITDRISFSSDYSGCTYGRVFAFLSCIYNPSPRDASETDTTIHYHKIETEPLRLKQVMTFTQESVKELVAFYSPQAVANFKQLKFRTLTPCPNISTTVVIKTEAYFEATDAAGQLRAWTGLYTVHINVNMSDQLPEPQASLLAIHILGEFPGVGLEANVSAKIDICGFKNSMIIFDREKQADGEYLLYADLIQSSRIYFPTKVMRGRRVIETVCLPEEGYFAVLLTPEQPRPDSSNDLIIFRATSLFNAVTRVFARVQVPVTHDRAFVWIDQFTPNVTVFTQQRGDNSGIHSFSQSFDYPHFRVVTRDPGSFDCQVQAAYGCDVKNTSFSVEVQKWVGASIVQPTVLRVYEDGQGSKVNLEEAIKFSGSFFNGFLVHLVSPDSIPNVGAFRLIPRLESIGQFGCRVMGSDYELVHVVSRKLIFGMNSFRIDVIHDLDENSTPPAFQVLSHLAATKQRTVLAATDIALASTNHSLFYWVELRPNQDTRQFEFFACLGVYYKEASSYAESCGPTQAQVLAVDSLDRARDGRLLYFAQEETAGHPLVILAYLSFIDRVTGGLNIVRLNSSLDLQSLQPGAPPSFHSSEQLLFKVIDRFTLHTDDFCIDQYFLTKVCGMSFLVEIAFNSELVKMRFWISDKNAITDYSSINLMEKYQDFVSSFACSLLHKACFVVLVGGKLSILPYKQKEDPSPPNSYAATGPSGLAADSPLTPEHFLKTFPVPSQFPVTDVLVGRKLLVLFNDRFEDHILVYHIGEHHHLYVGIKKEYGVKHLVSLVYNNDTDTEEILITNGKEIGQLFRTTPLLLHIGREANASDLRRLAVRINVLDSRCYSEALSFQLPFAEPAQPQSFQSLIFYLSGLFLLTVFLLVGAKLCYDQSLKSDFVEDLLSA